MEQHLTMEQNQQNIQVELRLPTKNDLAFIRWLWSDPETMKPVGGPIFLTDEQAQYWFAEIINPGNPSDFYRLIFNEKNEPVGEISFHQLNSVSMTAEFNIKIASSKRGKGYAKKAMLLFFEIFFNQMGGRIMIDDVALDNQGGQHLLLNFGFEHDSQFVDVFRLLLTCERYNSLYGFQVTNREKKADQ